MPRQTLYAYAIGHRSEDFANALERQLSAFVDSREWICSDVWVVNDPPKGEDARQVGLNLQLPDVGSEPSRWFQDVEAIATHLSQLATELDVEFAIGIGDAKTGIAEDLFTVTSEPPNLQQLREIIGV